MRAGGLAPFRLSRGNFKELYWSIAQMVTHHTSNGCDLRPGDLLASGTVSGPDSHGCLLEMGPVTLPNGEVRKFLEDGDEISLRGSAETLTSASARAELSQSTGQEACPTS